MKLLYLIYLFYESLLSMLHTVARMLCWLFIVNEYGGFSKRTIFLLAL